MTKLYRLAAVAGLCLLAALIVIGSPIDASAAPLAAKSAAFHYGDLSLYAAQLVLAVGADNLRAQHADLVARASAKLAEAGADGLTEAQVRAIEAEHTALLADVQTVATALTEAERSAGNNPQPPAPADNAAAVTAERNRAAEIGAIGARAAMPQDVIDAAVRTGVSVETFRTRAFDHLAAQADRTRTGGVRVLSDETQTRMSHMMDALTVRIGGTGALLNEETGQVRALPEGARGYRDYSLAEFAAEVVGVRRMRDAAQREDVLRRAFHSTSDFPVIFEGTINRVLQARYALQAPTYRQIAARRNFKDFRPHDVIRVGDFPMLKPVGEGGEIKFGTFGENKESVAVAPYAVQFAISRRMLIDDNMGAIEQLLGSYGQTVSHFENVTFYSMKAVGSGAGPVLNEDNKRVFHTDHGNLAGTPSVIDTTNLSKGRAAMRKQKNMDGKALNAVPKLILVGPDKETEADIAVAAITPTSTSGVNPFSGKFSVISEALIEGNGWELYADPAALPVFVWGLLDGYSAPRLRLDNPFGVQGVGVSLEHDFGVGAVDFRGAYRNAGA